MDDRELTYAKAINETLHQLMTNDEDVFLIGQGVTSPWYVGTTTIGLIERFGPKRIIDTPVSENAITGIGAGAAIAGLRPIVEHPRMDFMHLAMDQIANQIANWHFMLGGKTKVPITIWGIINRGGEQAAQHSQALHSIFAHIPGLKVVMPSTPYDVKGLLISSVYDDNPVIFVDDRWLYGLSGYVPESMYEEPLGKGVIRKTGNDITFIATSYMVHVALEAARFLEEKNINAEVLDLRTIKPLDKGLMFESVKKTGKVIVVDGGWRTCGFAAEISALLAENVFKYLKGPILRITLPDLPAPASHVLEDVYYPGSKDIVDLVLRQLKGDRYG